ncbi:hypothetical protein WICMUC_005417 [Wickerhamomyces mucosus]|uniref:Uncharacterized protein n=1 Tax=Wickerhamomyces mucosus TaxID=1378264 RepID=A0A9P8T6G5_9ASCO|nr:hypothetical protein WICMUC_005417 [Wickerhamomyces mucosus]
MALLCKEEEEDDDDEGDGLTAVSGHQVVYSVIILLIVDVAMETSAGDVVLEQALFEQDVIVTIVVVSSVVYDVPKDFELA